MELWQLIEADVHQCYGVDLSAPGLLEQRSGRWLRTLISGLFSTDSRVARELASEATPATAEEQ